tara:strand:+ start:11473 stop:12978 length:1506 start_codon:yes stop_codon:yes gene_type:complete
MNKGEIRTRVLEQVDWSPDQSASFKAKVDRFINRAYQQLALEAPFLFFEDEATIITQADVSYLKSEIEDRLAVNSSDKSVLRRSYDPSATTLTNSWPTDGTWDGRKIEIEDASGNIYRRTIREVWTDAASPATGGNTLDNLTIDTPWTNASDTGLKYRIFTPEYYLPPDVVEIRSVRMFSPTQHQIQVTNQYDMERYEYLDYRGNEKGRPVYVTRGKHFQIDAPTRAPKIKLAEVDPDKADDKWFGPDQAGQFDYCYTYAWGYRDKELKTHTNYQLPKWESAPSPVSGTAEVVDSTQDITVTLPNIDHILDFYQEWSGSALTTPTRSKRSGLRKRIYLRRYSATVPPDPSIRQEVSEIFYFLAEVDGDVEDYTHNGTDIPDYYQRLKETHGYQSIRFWPMPDTRYEIDMRVLRRPNMMVNDQDAPRIHEEAGEILVYKTLISLYESQGSAELSALAEQRYIGLLGTLSKRYAVIPRHRPRKKMARVTRSHLTTRVRFTENK